jgi:hypothetical protein
MTDISQTSRLVDSDENPITLRDACEVYFRNRIKVASLRAEAARGRLDIFRIGRTDFTTIKDLREMERRCRAEKQVRASISTRDASSGLSETARISSAQDALRRSVSALKGTSGNTLARNTNRSAGRTR